ncbi:MAG: aminopeptidase [Erysipelotrichaceae bacterium]
MLKQDLENYAKLIVEVGVNVQPKQCVILNTSINAIELTRYIVKAAYKRGASYVQVNYKDEVIQALDYEYRTVEELCDIPEWQINSKTQYVKEGCAIIHVISDTPGVFKDIDPNTMNKYALARRIALKELNDATMNSDIPWSIAAYPNIEWAKQVYPKDKEEIALEKLSKAILKSVHIDGNVDVNKQWEKHNEILKKRMDTLNGLNLSILKFNSNNGTNLKVGLIKNHIWCAGSELSKNNIEFQPNMPSEEIFTMPDNTLIDGVVYNSKPLDYNGQIIDNFKLVFKDGKVIDYEAKENEIALKGLIEFDQGSNSLGEVALVPYHSIISEMNVLFKNTLFDENASCHLALGSSYPMNVKNGTNLNKEELNKLNANISNTHVDFMFGTKDMSIIGIDQNDKEIVIFKDGDFII